jgi:hypothetical protein
MEPLSSISPAYDRGTEGLSGVSIFLWLTRILFTIAHTSQVQPGWTGTRVSRCAQISAQDGCHIAG